jgi:hypothetical protein
MNVADLIKELGKYPGHLPVYAALSGDNYEMCDTEGMPFTVNLTRELDCLAVDRIVYEGTRIEIVGEWLPGVDELNESEHVWNDGHARVADAPADSSLHVARFNAAIMAGWNPDHCSLSFFEKMAQESEKF